eukprot:TRINITY_DN85378_c0_g1_i1.p1 TRINITY_DN85378_c0_g1~~TRINITY_DN85378_c0_g1_i1.p1  ORF type:complete len:106 (+),score=12.65 TRINITY_DN85378_c0_g1_i1:33-320(+)
MLKEYWAGESMATIQRQNELDQELYQHARELADADGRVYEHPAFREALSKMQPRCSGEDCVNCGYLHRFQPGRTANRRWGQLQHQSDMSKVHRRK